MIIDVELANSFHAAVSPTPSGSFERLATVKEWLESQQFERGAMVYACSAIIGWLDIDVRDERLKAAILLEVAAIRTYLEQ